MDDGAYLLEYFSQVLEIVDDKARAIRGRRDMSRGGLQVVDYT